MENPNSSEESIGENSESASHSQDNHENPLSDAKDVDE